MSILKIKSGDFEMEISMDGNSVKEVKSDGKTLADSNADIMMGVIALALNQYGESSLHDNESGVITIARNHTEWNSKSFGLNKWNQNNKQ